MAIRLKMDLIMMSIDKGFIRFLCRVRRLHQGFSIQLITIILDLW